jgi:predicted nucleic acid-binding protein
VPEIAVADTGPLLHLAEIGETGQLCIFDAVLVTEQVRGELIRLDIDTRVVQDFSDLLQVHSVSQNEMQTQTKTFSRFRLHRTDLSVVALAIRVRPNVVLTDDLQLRRALESQGFTAVGSIGILFRALKTGRLSKKDTAAKLDQLLDDSSLYTSKAFRVAVRKRVEEALE